MISQALLVAAGVGLLALLRIVFRDEWREFREGIGIRLWHELFAVMVHALLAAFLLVGVQCSPKIEAPMAIEGVIVSQQPPRPVAAPQAEPQPQPAPEPQPQPQPEPPKPDLAEQQRQQEEQAAAVQKKAQEAEAAQRALLEQQRQQELQQQLIAQEKAKAEADAKLRAQEEQKKAAEAETARKQAEEEKQKAVLAAAKQKAEADRKAKEEQSRKAAAALEQKERQEELQAALGEQDQSDIANEWYSQMALAIKNAWTYEPGEEGLSCHMKLVISPSGEVTSANVDKSSGNPLFDASAVRAAYKASPLPTPRDPAVFRADFGFTFKPGG